MSTHRMNPHPSTPPQQQQQQQIIISIRNFLPEGIQFKEEQDGQQIEYPPIPSSLQSSLQARFQVSTKLQTSLPQQAHTLRPPEFKFSGHNEFKYTFLTHMSPHRNESPSIYPDTHQHSTLIQTALLNLHHNDNIQESPVL